VKTLFDPYASYIYLIHGSPLITINQPLPPLLSMVVKMQSKAIHHLHGPDYLCLVKEEHVAKRTNVIK
jgi:hypothetical protein